MVSFWTILPRGYLFVFTKNSVVNFAIFGRCVMFGAFVTFCPKWRLENRFSKGMYLKKACEPRHNVLFLVSEAGENLNRDHCAKHKHSGQKLRSSLHNLLVNTNKYPLAFHKRFWHFEIHFNFNFESFLVLFWFIYGLVYFWWLFGLIFGLFLVFIGPYFCQFLFIICPFSVHFRSIFGLFLLYFWSLFGPFFVNFFCPFLVPFRSVFSLFLV